MMMVMYYILKAKDSIPSHVRALTADLLPGCCSKWAGSLLTYC